MPAIFTTSYEITGAGIPVAIAHKDSCDAARDACFKTATSLGATGFRPDRYGIRSLFFDGDIPKGWRKIGTDGGMIEAVPNKSKALSEIRALFSAPDCIPPSNSHLAREFGYNPSAFAMDGSTIYFVTSVMLKLPTPRYFLRVPRFADDGWSPPATLTAIPESELMRAIEDHNAAVRALGASA